MTARLTTVPRAHAARGAARMRRTNRGLADHPVPGRPLDASGVPQRSDGRGRSQQRRTERVRRESRPWVADGCAARGRARRACRSRGLAARGRIQARSCARPGTGRDRAGSARLVGAAATTGLMSALAATSAISGVRCCIERRARAHRRRRAGAGTRDAGNEHDRRQEPTAGRDGPEVSSNAVHPNQVMARGLATLRRRTGDIGAAVLRRLRAMC